MPPALSSAFVSWLRLAAFRSQHICHPPFQVRLYPGYGWPHFEATNPKYPQQRQQAATQYIPDRTQIWFRCILAGQIPPKAPHKLRTPSLAQSDRQTRRRRKSSWGARVRRREGYGRRFLPCLPSPRQSYDLIFFIYHTTRTRTTNVNPNHACTLMMF